MTDTKLLPCPFCGGTPRVGAWNGDGIAIDCSSNLTRCPVSPSHYDFDAQAAIAAWNRRAQPEPRVAELEAEVERLRAYGEACAKAEREACAKACAEVDLHSGDHLKNSDPRVTCAAAIRAR